jgi:hypothetical protein
MTETPPGTPPPDPPPDPPPGDPPPDPPAPTADDVVKNPQALIDALGSVRDENRRLGRRLKDYEKTERERTDASKTELQRATERATTAETTLAQRDLQVLRTTVALEQLLGDDPRIKLALTLADRLQGTSREEIAKDAAEMRQLLGQGTAPPPGQRPDYGSGSRLDNGGGTPGSDAAFNAQLRRAAGRG